MKAIFCVVVGIVVSASSQAATANSEMNIRCQPTAGIQSFLHANPGVNKYATMTAATVNRFRSSPATVGVAPYGVGVGFGVGWTGYGFGSS